TRAAEACGFATVPLYVVVSGSLTDRIYTTDATEVERALEGGAYLHENVLANVYSNSTGPRVPNAVPLYRLWSASKTDHFVTTSWDEVQSAVDSNGYEYQGVIGYAYRGHQCGDGAFYRMFRPDIEVHYYTLNSSEIQTATSKGYMYEGITAYVFPA
ncbi:hypothetical protein OH76DRAFT_1345054, partial [Lentinus brumalis]